MCDWSPSTKPQSSPDLNTGWENQLKFKGTCIATESLHLESKGLQCLSLQDNQPRKPINLHPKGQGLREGRNRGGHIDSTSKPGLQAPAFLLRRTRLLREEITACYFPSPNGGFRWFPCYLLPLLSEWGGTGRERTRSTCSP